LQSVKGGAAIVVDDTTPLLKSAPRDFLSAPGHPFRKSLKKETGSKLRSTSEKIVYSIKTRAK
jgi:hypothetical protein